MFRSYNLLAGLGGRGAGGGQGFKLGVFSDRPSRGLGACLSCKGFGGVAGVWHWQGFWGMAVFFPYYYPSNIPYSIPNLAQLGPNLAQLGPNLAQLGPNLAQLGPICECCLGRESAPGGESFHINSQKVFLLSRVIYIIMNVLMTTKRSLQTYVSYSIR